MTISPHIDAAIGIWPSEELEYLGYCPLCRSTQRRVLHIHLTDRLFHCAPGEWTMHKCQSCDAAYLDPRPTPQSIGRAYSQYFTHGDATSLQHRASQSTTHCATPSERVRQWLSAGLNGYRNAKWQMTLIPANAWGRWWVPCLWPLRSVVQHQMRHLPHRPPRQGARLLDVGCGNGNFLALAQEAGWVVEGVDFDPLAVSVAQKQGLNVHIGGLEQVRQHAGDYDWISCSHVIEHVHDPVQWLQDMHALLRPDGTLWLQTPNIESWGHTHFGANWRGLEPPRHLVLFTPSELRKKLETAGFESIKTKRLPVLVMSSVIAASEALRDNRYAAFSSKLHTLLKFRYLVPYIWRFVSKKNAEFITVTAKKSA